MLQGSQGVAKTTFFILSTNLRINPDYQIDGLLNRYIKDVHESVAPCSSPLPSPHHTQRIHPSLLPTTQLSIDIWLPVWH